MSSASRRLTRRLVRLPRRTRPLNSVGPGGDAPLRPGAPSGAAALAAARASAFLAARAARLLVLDTAIAWSHGESTAGGAGSPGVRVGRGRRIAAAACVA